MILRWLADGAVPYHNDWEVDFVRIHTTPMRQPDDVFIDQLVMYVSATADQIQKIIDDNGRDNIPLDLLGIKVFTLKPNTTFWTWRYPGIKSISYTRFEIYPEKRPLR